MIAGHHEHVGLFLQQNRQRGVEILDGFFLRGEVAVFTVFVGVFVVDEKEIEVVVFGEVTLELLSDGRRAFDFFHADELREAFIHRINREARGLELVALLEQRNVRLVRNATHEEPVRRLFLRDDR